MDNMFDVISLSTEDDSGSNSEGDSDGDSDADVDVEDVESNSSNENSAMESDGSVNDLPVDEEEAGWETTSENED